MIITNIIFSGTPREEFVAYVAITFDRVFVVKGMRLIRQKATGNYHLAMPQRRKPDNSYTDVAHPLSLDFRKNLEQAVLAEYNRIPQGNREHAEQS